MNTYSQEEKECIEAILGLGIECNDDIALMAWEEIMDSLEIA